MDSLSIVCTPMQLVNCIEALSYYKSDNNSLLIISSGVKLIQIKRLLNEYDTSFFYKIFFFNETQGINNLWKKKKVIKEMAQKDKYDIVFASNYKHSYQKYMLVKVKRHNPDVKIVLIDDGLSVYETSDRRLNELSTGKADVQYFSMAYKFFFRQSIHSFVPKSIEFFTVYENLKISKSDTFALNSYNYLKEKKIGIDDDLESNEIVVILGQPLVDKSIGIDGLTKESYSLSIIDSIKELHFEQRKIVYYPHPAENYKLTLTSELAESAIIKEPQYPFEMIALQLPTDVPIIGFYSSALINLHKMNPFRIVYSIYIKEIASNMNKQYIGLHKVYDYLSENGIYVLNKN